MTAGPRALLDTDTLSLIMRRNPLVLSRANSYLQAYPSFTFSIITRYEILRGLKAKAAGAQLKAFEKFCGVNNIIPISNEIIEMASDIYAELYKTGNLIGDADILIAATALVENFV